MSVTAELLAAVQEKAHLDTGRLTPLLRNDISERLKE